MFFRNAKPKQWTFDARPGDLPRPLHPDSANDGFSATELNRIRRLVQTNSARIVEAWHEHCD